MIDNLDCVCFHQFDKVETRVVETRDRSCDSWERDRFEDIKDTRLGFLVSAGGRAAGPARPHVAVAVTATHSDRTSHTIERN